MSDHELELSSCHALHKADVAVHKTLATALK